MCGLVLVSVSCYIGLLYWRINVLIKYILHDSVNHNYFKAALTTGHMTISDLKFQYI